MPAQRRWSELSTGQQVAVIALGAVEVALTAVAAVDLVRRDPATVRGSKWLWAPALVVQPFGPVAYLALGRKAAPA
ncbi:MAG: hypothetical protein RLZ55_183 [Actinomycetota bacterium]|jgi:hypothetical protein